VVLYYILTHFGKWQPSSVAVRLWNALGKKNGGRASHEIVRRCDSGLTDW